MARVYEGLAARVLGTAGGLLMFGTGAGMYVFMSATASNVPLPSRLEAAIHEAVPALEASAGQAMPLPLLVVFGLVSLVLVGIGLLFALVYALSMFDAQRRGIDPTGMPESRKAPSADE
jgi:hypothetical protein